MATVTPVSKVIATTGASGGAGMQTMVTAQNAAVASAVTTAQGVTGVQPYTLQISPALLIVDTTSTIFEMVQTITYITVV